MNKRFKVFVADDHPIIRNGLIAEINSSRDFEVIGQAENGKEALEKLSSYNPDIVILDIDMPIMDGIETAKIINSEFPPMNIVFLSMYKEKEIINSIAKLDMKGYVLKDSAVIEIVSCLETVVQGDKFFSPQIKEMFVSCAKNNNKETLISSLSPTEIDILIRISDLKTSREIAEDLFISIRTVENHRYKISRKLDIQGNHSLLKYAIDNKSAILEYSPAK